MNVIQKFSGLAEVYAKGRPAYASRFIEDLYSKYGVSESSIIADIGSGTGKFAKQLLDRGSIVYCVEPNADMRNAAVEQLQNFEKFRAVDGSAGNTKLEDESVDYITVAQAFHWFDVEAFKKECKRILRDNGGVFLIWNMRDMTNEVNQRSYDIYRKYCPKFKGFGGGIQKDDARIKVFFDGIYDCVEYKNPLYYDKEMFINRSLSGSYSLKPNDEKYDEYIQELKVLFDKYAENGYLEMANDTIVYYGRGIKTNE